MELIHQLQNCDNNATQELVRIYAGAYHSKTFTDELVALIAIPSQAIGASWLLKHHLETGETLSQKQVSIIYHSFPKQTEWEARLHLLQLLPKMPIETSERKVVEAFVRRGLSDPNKFIRAWSYNGMYELAKRFPELRGEAQTFFDMALKDESASVKARIKNVLKKGF